MKWWLYTVACVCNGVTATIILLFFFYEIIIDNTAFTFTDGLGSIVVLLGYTIYIISEPGINFIIIMILVSFNFGKTSYISLAS
ncbi:MAG: hypothetical protein IPN43_18190 [Chitinophagaceae bacterium]|nr:hypothetical protein [Chitinophagaceae bacterium]